jgi:hypothetical protein
MSRQFGRLLLTCFLCWSTFVGAQQANSGLLSINSAAVSLQLDATGVGYGLDSEGQVWRKVNKTGSNWQRLPGRFAALRVGMDDSVWGITFDFQALKLISQAWWQKFAVDTTDIAVGPDGTVSALSADGKVYQLDAITGEKLTQLAAIDLPITRLRADEHGLLWAWSHTAPQSFLRRFDGKQWVVIAPPLAAGLRELAAGPQGAIMAVSQAGAVHRWDANSKQWLLLDQIKDVQDVAIGPEDKPWFLNNSGRILATDLFIQVEGARQETKPALFTRLLTWKRVRGAATDISVSAQRDVLTVDTQSNVWQWKGKDTWTLMPGRMRKVAAAAQGAWGIDLEGRVMRFAGGYWTAQGLAQATHIAVAENGDAFALADNGKLFVFNAAKRQWFFGGGPAASDLAVGKLLPWLIDLNGRVWTWRDGAWVELPAINAQTIGVGSEGSVYVTTPDQAIMWLDKRENIWKAASGKASKIAVGAGGAPWIIGERNETYGSTLFFAENDKAIDARDAQALAAIRPVFTIPPPAASILPPSTKPVSLTSFIGVYQDVGVGADGSVMAVGLDGGLYCLQRADQRFALIGGATGRQVAVDQNGMPWLINQAQDLQRFYQGRWQNIADFKALDVAIGTENAAYAIEKNQQIVHRFFDAVPSQVLGQDGNPIRAKKLAVLGAQLWLITPTDRVSMCTARKCNSYNQIAQDIATSAEGTVMIVDSTGALLRYDPKLDSFVSYQTSVMLSKALSLAPQGLPWLVSQSGIVSGATLLTKSSVATNKDCTARFQNKVPATNPVTVQLIARTDNVQVLPSGVFNPLTNDSINGLIPSSAAVIFRLVSGSPLLAAVANGVQVSAQATAGALLTATYTICVQPTGAPCSSALINVKVISPVVLPAPVVLLAQAETVSVVAGATASVNVLGNDLRNGQPVQASQVTVVLLAGSSQFMSVAGSSINIAVGGQAGDTLVGSYAICALPASTPCSTATLTVSVAAAPILLQAQSDAGTVVVGGSASFNVLANDLRNGQPVQVSQVNLKLLAGSSQFMGVAGSVINVAVGGQAGSTLVGGYSICALPGNSPCSTATLTVSVTAAPIALQAQSDAGSVAQGATASFNVLGNDLRNGQPVQTFQVSFNLLAGSSQLMSSSGSAINIAVGAQFGDILVGNYAICALPGNTPCSTATLTVSVTAAPITVQAVADTGSVVAGAAASFNVLVNDVRNGQPVQASQVSLNLLAGSSQLMSISGSAISIAVGAQSGDTLIGNYAICALPANTPCSTATLTVQVTAPPITLQAQADTGSVVQGATASFSVLANDLRNGQPVQASQVNLTLLSGSSQRMSVVGGAINVAVGAQAGDTLVASYSICALPGNTPCSTATLTIQVTAPPITLQAQADAATAYTGVTATINVLANDLRNGQVVQPAQVSLNLVAGASPFMSVVGSGININPGALAGEALFGSYTICALPSGLQCSTATLTVQVAQALVANSDVTTLAYNAAGTSFNLLANDTYLGQPIALAVNVAGAVGDAFALQLSPSGDILMFAGAPGPATHTATYTVCLPSVGNPCATNTVAITVGVPALQALGWTATVAAGGFFEANNGVQYGAGLGTQNSVMITVTPAPASANDISVVSNGITSSPSRVTVNPFTQPNKLLTGTVQYCNRLQPLQCSSAPWRITVQ